MRLNYFFSAASALIKAKVFKIKIPLAIGWSLTSRCNQRCPYCGIWKNPCQELDTSEIFNMIEGFKKLGTKWIAFTGGEPLLRNDLGDIIKYTKDKEIYVSVSSNGLLVTERINQLKDIDVMKLSLDGPPSINDGIRGNGSFDKAIEAIESCQRNSIPVCIQCTLSKYNLDSFDYIINLASKFKIKALFQPATKQILCSNELNPLSAPVDKYRAVINYLIFKKRQGAPILNSLPCLQHLYYWPGPKRIRCAGGLLSFNVEPDGAILACDRMQKNLSGRINSSFYIKRLLKKVSPVLGCNQCWSCPVVESSLIFSLNFNAIFNYLKNY